MNRKKSDKNIKQQLYIKNDRGPTFTGIRPAVIESGKQKNLRRQKLKQNARTLFEESKESDFEF